MGPYIVASQDAHDFAVTVELHEEALLHVLLQLSAHVSYQAGQSWARRENKVGTFLSSGWA